MQKRIDLTDLDFRPIPGEDDYSVMPIYDEGRFRRPGAVGPYENDASQFKVASLGIFEDTSYFVRDGLNQALPPISQQLAPIYELMRLIEIFLRSKGYRLKINIGGGEAVSGAHFWRDTFNWVKEPPESKTLNVRLIGTHQKLAYVQKPALAGMGFLPKISFLQNMQAKMLEPARRGWGMTLGQEPADGAEDLQIVVTPSIDIAEIAKQAALQSIPGISLISGIVKSLKSLISGRRQAKAGPHVEKWLGWLELEQLSDLIPVVSASFVTAGGQLPQQGAVPSTEYMAKEYGSPSLEKWKAFGQNWEATPLVYQIDWLREKLKASVAPLNAIADQRAREIAAAMQLQKDQRLLSVPQQVEEIGKIVQDLVNSGMLRPEEAEAAIAALHKIQTQEPLTEAEAEIVNTVREPIVKQKRKKLLKVALPAAAIAAKLLLF